MRFAFALRDPALYEGANHLAPARRDGSPREERAGAADLLSKGFFDDPPFHHLARRSAHALQPEARHQARLAGPTVGRGRLGHALARLAAAAGAFDRRLAVRILARACAPPAWRRARSTAAAAT